MPSRMPGDDYYTNFRVGDPYVKVDQGFARLPGECYAALHPELEGVNPEDYPDIHKLAILADVAPYSREGPPRPANPKHSRARAGDPAHSSTPSGVLGAGFHMIRQQIHAPSLSGTERKIAHFSSEMSLGRNCIEGRETRVFRSSLDTYARFSVPNTLRRAALV